MSQGKRLVLEDNDFIDEDDGHQQQQASNNNSQKKVVGISSSSSSNNNNNNNSGNGAQQQGTIDSQLLRSSRPDVEKIISAHRQSLIGLQSGNGGGTSGTVTADDLQKFNSITLSKRHLYSDTDYEKGLDLETFKKLSNFKFDSSAETNAKQQQQQQQANSNNSNAGVGAEKK